jgi:acylphosphatase
MSILIERVRIEGRVQGVWFRAWTVDEARLRGLRGWVRNRLDGTVEALFAGCPEAVEEMIALCRRGSPASQVMSIHRYPATGDELTGEGFRQLPTE